MLWSSHVRIRNLHKISYIAKDWQDAKLMRSPQKMREKLGAGRHIMIQSISSNVHASMNASNLQTPLKSKSWLETEARSIHCVRTFLFLIFPQVCLAIREFFLWCQWTKKKSPSKIFHKPVCQWRSLNPRAFMGRMKSILRVWSDRTSTG